MKLTEVVDANGKKVGKLLAILDEDTALVELVVGAKSFYGRVTKDGFAASVNRPVHWLSSTCGVGQGYWEYPFTADPDVMLTQEPLNFSLPGKTVYAPDLTVEPDDIDFDDGSMASGSCTPFGPGTNMLTVIPVTPLVDLEEAFQVPFRFQ